MSLLSDLPDEILNLISIRLNGFDNCFLWMASDSKLKQRLVNNIITDFDINYTIPGRYLWPGNFLKRLSKLSRLSLVVEPSVNHIPIQNIEISPIPTLKYLIFNFANFAQLFYQKQATTSDDPTGPTTSSSDRYNNLNDYYGNLEHLEIPTRWLEGDLFSIDFLRCLPRKLKSLSIPNNYFELDSQNPSDDLNVHIEALPSTLTALDIRFYHPYDNRPYLDFSRLPPNLTSLNTNILVDDQKYHMIPNHLKLLSMEGNPCNLKKLSPHLPTGLESLEITINAPPTSEMFTHLENLESLSFRPQSALQLDHLVTKCPPKLKNFSCSIVTFADSFVPSQLFNTCLTRLVLNNASGITAQFISALPESLTDLMISQFGAGEPYPYFALLPRKLKSLSSTLNTVENISLLPDTLTCLQLTSQRPCIDSYFDRFPPKLELLEVQQTLPLSIMKQLPASLTRLNVYSDQYVDDEVVRMLPRGLKHLASFAGADNITDAGAANFPEGLKFLYLSSNTRLTDHGIGLLPRSLTHLALPQNPNFTDECIKHLPPRLTALYLDSATRITSKSCKDLPKYLEALDLSRCTDWNSETLIASKNELPQFIGIINLGNEEARETWGRIQKE